MSVGDRSSWAGIPLGYICLATLAIQNALLNLVMHYSRVMPPPNGKRYFTSTAVLLNEVLKLIICLYIVFRVALLELPPGSAKSTTALAQVRQQVFGGDGWKLIIPAALYTVQNNLQYLAIGNLDAATFQVTYQLKTLMTAVFSVTLLHRRLSRRQWFSLVLLMAGVAFVSVSSQDNKTHEKAATKSYHANMNRVVGLVAVAVACAISGLAGVYFEKILKDSNQVSLWVRNVQMSFWSLFPALIGGVIIKDGAEISKVGFFAGYNHVVWLAILSQALGGLLVALVVKYTDNITKNFATSISIVLSFIASVYLFNFDMSINFGIGMLLVLYATYLYGSPDKKKNLAATGEPAIEYAYPNQDQAATEKSLALEKN